MTTGDAVPDQRCSERVYRNKGNPPLLALLSGGTGRTILDCGCGAGDNARSLASMGWTVDGLTISAQEADLARQVCRQVAVADLEHGLPHLGTSYDVVLMSHVLEHLDRPAPLLADVKQVLKPTGHIVVALPNVLYWRNRLDLLSGRFEYTQEGIMDRTHVRFYTHASGRRLLERHGFTIVHSSASGRVPWFVARRPFLHRLVGSIDRMGCKWRPGFFGVQSLYVGVVTAGGSTTHQSR
jgi:SAM-dependent methyltransferase